MAALSLQITTEELEEMLRRAIEPLRQELEQLRGARASLVPLPEAARRLGVTLRSVQQWAKDGRLEVEQVGGVRMVRLPAGTGQG